MKCAVRFPIPGKVYIIYGYFNKALDLNNISEQARSDDGNSFLCLAFGLALGLALGLAIAIDPKARKFWGVDWSSRDILPLI